MGQESGNAGSRMSRAIELLSADDRLTEMCHRQWCGKPLPSVTDVERVIGLCRALIFPGYFSDSTMTAAEIPHRIGVDLHSLLHMLTAQIEAAHRFGADECQALPLTATPDELALRFVENLPEIRRLLYTDVRATYLADPAAVSTREIIYCYPGIRATLNHRVAHTLYHLGIPILPRMISESAHRETGIDIHPAATIGESFVIDHGTGIVIGATAILGHHVTIYQGVTLGAKSFATDADNNPVKGLPRHPIIGNRVVIYSNASILGRVTVGDDAVIGGNVWLTRNVAPGEKIVQASPAPLSSAMAHDQ